jgi:hypothetical protein
LLFRSTTFALGLLLGVVYLYKKNKLTFLVRLPRYKPLDRSTLVDYAAEIDGHHKREDGEIVMNLDDSPFNTLNRSPAHV